MSDLFPAQYKLFHYFIIYISEDIKFIGQTQANESKGRGRKTPYCGHEKWIKFPYDKG